MEVWDFRRRIWDQIRELSDRMDYTFRVTNGKYGLTVIQFRVLLEIMKEPVTVGKVGQRLGIAHGNTSSMCKRLEKEGFLERVRSEEDERQVYLCLTEKGRETVGSVLDTLQEKYAHILENERPEELDAMMRGLEELNRLMGQMKDLDS